MSERSDDAPLRVGFLGLGTMGAPMARRLLDAGFDLTVHNRTREREEPLAAAGAARAATPRELAAGRDVIVTMVGDTPDVREVLEGEDGILAGVASGAVIVDMSTIDPAATRELAAAAAARGARLLDAPCSGGSEGAERGTLSIMVGGDADALARARPVLETLGGTITHVGGPGAGQTCKAVNQVIIAGTYAAVAEGLTLAMASGIDVDAAVSALSGGAAGSWVLANRAENMIRGAYPLGFRTRLHRKDLRIALAAAREAEVPLPLAAWVEGLETALVRRGHGDEDVSALARTFREAAGIDRPGES